MNSLNATARHEIAKHCFDQDLAFRIRNRRNRLLGLWAADQAGLSPDAAAEYAVRVVGQGIELRGDEALVRAIAADSAASAAPLDEAAIAAEMDRLAVIAARELAAGTASSQLRAA
ncbi:MAG: DUF1476 family protein [Rhodospirillales bacterium]|nr:DUF1476 family protein [Rhodospirillales bacterium]